MIFKYWDDKCVVYHSDSGNTHLLTTPHAILLELLREKFTRKETIRKIISMSIVNSDAEANKLIDTISNTYKQLDLVD